MSRRFRLILFPLAFMLTFGAGAADFPVTVTPTILKMAGDEGDKVMREIAFLNQQQWPTPLKLEAVNWAFDEDGRRVFGPDIKVPHDCRSWWTAGFADLLIKPGAGVIYRLEIQIPDDIDDEMECHFAVAVIPRTGEDQSPKHYVPVYINAEGAEPELEFQKLLVKGTGKDRRAMVVIRNTGTAHARVLGMLEGEDAQDQDLDLVVKPTEILAGETRAIPLLVSKRGGGEAWWSPPLEVEGKLNWDGGELEIEGELR